MYNWTIGEGLSSVSRFFSTEKSSEISALFIASPTGQDNATRHSLFIYSFIIVFFYFKRKKQVTMKECTFS